MFRKILVANRCEIAIRIMRAARELGIETVAIYHEIDIAQPFVHYADYAFKITAETPKEAYLDIEQIVETAVKSGCDVKEVVTHGLTSFLKMLNLHNQ